MGMKDETEPVSGKLADVLYTLGLIVADEGQCHRLLNSRELDEFEEWLREKYSKSTL